MPRKKRESTVRPLLLTIPDVATMLQVCENTVYHLIYDEGLPSLTLGDKENAPRRVHPTSLAEWLKSREQQKSA